MSGRGYRSFTPGNKANLRLLLQKELLRQYYANFNNTSITDNINNADDITESSLCSCTGFRANPVKQGYNDPSQTENNRIAQILTGTLGGRTTYGNFNQPVFTTYLGGWEGQPGGLPKPLRNKF
jgi:hypothetical protein